LYEKLHYRFDKTTNFAEKLAKLRVNGRRTVGFHANFNPNFPFQQELGRFSK